MNRTLIFHIGDFKTGTTAIQRWLAEHGQDQGLFRPDIDATALAHSLKSPDQTATAFRALARTLRRAQKSPDRPVAVVSSEHFEHAKPADLAGAIATHLPEWAGRVRVLAYVRPHGSALLARYGESVKIGNFTGDLAAYLEWAPTRWRLDTHPRFSAWRAAFGKGFALRFYDRGAFAGGDVVRDFVLAVTGQDPGVQAGAPKINPTPGLHDLALLRALHSAIGPLPEGTPEQAAQWALGRDLGRRLAQRDGPATGPNRLCLSQSVAHRLIKLCARDAAATDADFFEAPRLTTALNGDHEAAAETATLPDLDSILPADTRAVLDLWGRMLVDGLARPGGAAALLRLIGE